MAASKEIRDEEVTVRARIKHLAVGVAIADGARMSGCKRVRE